MTMPHISELKNSSALLYCPTERQLVSVVETNENGEIELVCQRCGAHLWRKIGFEWSPVAGQDRAYLAWSTNRRQALLVGS